MLSALAIACLLIGASGISSQDGHAHVLAAEMHGSRLENRVNIASPGHTKNITKPSSLSTGSVEDYAELVRFREGGSQKGIGNIYKKVGGAIQQSVGAMGGLSGILQRATLLTMTTSRRCIMCEYLVQMVDRKLRADPYVRYPGLESFLPEDLRYEPAGEDIVRPPPVPRVNPMHNAPPMPPWKHPPPPPGQPPAGAALDAAAAQSPELQAMASTPGSQFYSTASALAGHFRNGYRVTPMAPTNPTVQPLKGVTMADLAKYRGSAPSLLQVGGEQGVTMADLAKYRGSAPSLLQVGGEQGVTMADLAKYRGSAPSLLQVGGEQGVTMADLAKYRGSAPSLLQVGGERQRALLHGVDGLSDGGSYEGEPASMGVQGTAAGYSSLGGGPMTPGVAQGFAAQESTAMPGMLVGEYGMNEGGEGMGPRYQEQVAALRAQLLQVQQQQQEQQGPSSMLLANPYLAAEEGTDLMPGVAAPPTSLQAGWGVQQGAVPQGSQEEEQQQQQGGMEGGSRFASMAHRGGASAGAGAGYVSSYGAGDDGLHSAYSSKRKAAYARLDAMAGGSEEAREAGGSESSGSYLHAGQKGEEVEVGSKIGNAAGQVGDGEVEAAAVQGRRKREASSGSQAGGRLSQAAPAAPPSAPVPPSSAHSRFQSLGAHGVSGAHEASSQRHHRTQPDAHSHSHSHTEGSGTRGAFHDELAKLASMIRRGGEGHSRRYSGVEHGVYEQARFASRRHGSGGGEALQQDGLQRLGAQLGGLAGRARDLVRGVSARVVGDSPEGKEGRGSGPGVAEALGAAALEHGKKVGAAALEHAKQLGATALEHGKQVGKAVHGHAQAVAGKAKEWLETDGRRMGEAALDKGKEVAGKAKEWLETDGRRMGEAALDTGKEVAGKAKEWLETDGRRMGEAALDKGKQFASQAKEWLETDGKRIANEVKEQAQAAALKAKKKLIELKNKAKEAAKAAIKDASKSLEKAAKEAGGYDAMVEGYFQRHRDRLLQDRLQRLQDPPPPGVPPAVEHKLGEREIARLEYRVQQNREFRLMYDHVMDALSDVCEGLIPRAQQQACRDLYSHAPKLTELMIHGYQPDEICTMVRQCKVGFFDALT